MPLDNDLNYENFEKKYQQHRVSHLPIGQWMFKKIKDVAGSISGKAQERKEQLSSLQSAFKDFENAPPPKKEEMAKKLYTLLDETQKKCEQQKSVFTSGMSLACIEFKNAIKNEFPQVTSKAEEIENIFKRK